MNGFKAVQLLMENETTSDLDETMCIVNNFYKVYREHLETLEQIEGERFHMLVGLVDVE